MSSILSSIITDQLNHLHKKIHACQGALRFRLQNRLKRLQKKPQSPIITQQVATLTHDIEQAIALRQQRIDQLPQPNYPPELPVSDKKESIQQAIIDHQVVIICGETGSGKTTQLPKICMDAGRGIDGFIGHTQPRRLAARSVAARISEEMGSPLGKHSPVGYKVRFQDRTHQAMYVKLMTDGILLAEIQEDRYLNQYDTLIIDEAHERSLNIDFMLGYMKWLLKRRPTLKLIITSATIDADRFSSHFNNAPVINVSGRTYPVEIRYRPLSRQDDSDDEHSIDIQEGIIEAVRELSRESMGDILIFLPGEREIRETADALTQENLRNTEILPLFARLSAKEQNRIFSHHRGRRLILSTNVAETSLTVPGIKYVIDTGLVRMSRYSWRARIQRLPIETTSQASSNQRSGRCGRTSNGIAIRLYSEEDFLNRREFTEPEILRTNLASVILQMASARIGDIETFPFLEAPDKRLIKDGYKLLFELHAINQQRQLTPLGRQLSRLPIDPSLSAMLLAAEKHQALNEVLIIVSALSVQDPRERPMDKQQASDEKHARFKEITSDFMAYFNLWNYFHKTQKELTQNQHRKLCKREYISYLRMREWIDIHRQIKDVIKDLTFNKQPADFDAIHKSLLTGLLSQVALKEIDRSYLGANNRKLMIFPGSGLKKKQPKWIMSFEIVETSHVFARTVAEIQPEWIEAAAHHLIKRSYSEPHWQKRSSQVSAFERITLYGLPLINRRKINYGPIDPKESREIFIRHALVYGEYHSKAPFYQHNRSLIDDIEQLEAKSRRRDLLVDEEILYDFYDELIPDTIYNGPLFEGWRKRCEKKEPQALFLTQNKLLQRTTEHVTETHYPNQMSLGDTKLPLSYHFEPGSDQDGITVTIPLIMLNQLKPEPFEYLIPGLLEDKITAIIRALPKALRKNFVPAPEFAKACMDTIEQNDPKQPLLDALRQLLLRMTGVTLPDHLTLNALNLDPHLHMRYQVVDEQGKVINTGRDLKALQKGTKHTTERRFQQLPTQQYERDLITQWDFDTLAESIEVTHHGITLKTYPALVDNTKTIAIKLFDSQGIAAQKHINGLLRLLILSSPDEYRYLSKNLPNSKTLCLAYATLDTCLQLTNDIIFNAYRQSFLHPQILNQITEDNTCNNRLPLAQKIRSKQAFDQLLALGKVSLIEHGNELCRLLAPTLAQYQTIHKRMKGNIPFNWLEALKDIKEQLDYLIYKGFVSDIQLDNLRHLPRYIKAISRRLDKLEHNPAADRALRVQIAPYWNDYKDYLNKQAIDHHQLHSCGQEQLIKYRWMLEEFRVSLFAQELGTEQPVSAKRLNKMAWKGG